jgi:two-component system, NarL family, nitrate/nitrite response regulator NarL
LTRASTIRLVPLGGGKDAMSNGTRVRVYVADDHPVFRDGVVLALRRRPEFEVVGEAENGRTAL